MVAIGMVALTSMDLLSVKTESNGVLATVATDSIPGELNVIFKNSCMECHATGGKGFAKSKLNFSEWASYKAQTQAKKATAICNEVMQDAMPPKSYVKAHPNAALTASQKDLICNWSKSLAAKP